MWIARKTDDLKVMCLIDVHRNSIERHNLTMQSNNITLRFKFCSGRELQDLMVICWIHISPLWRREKLIN